MKNKSYCICESEFAPVHGCYLCSGGPRLKTRRYILAPNFYHRKQGCKLRTRCQLRELAAENTLADVYDIIAFFSLPITSLSRLADSAALKGAVLLRMLLKLQPLFSCRENEDREKLNRIQV